MVDADFQTQEQCQIPVQMWCWTRSTVNDVHFVDTFWNSRGKAGHILGGSAIARESLLLQGPRIRCEI